MEPHAHWSDLSPTTRSVSPSPEAIPSTALAAGIQLDRCVSSPPSLTPSVSSRSVSSSSDSGIPSVRRRGYVRPQGTAFSTSAKNRESVMSLGSIAHMQYYFARTGLLDGKGGQFAKRTTKMATEHQPVTPEEHCTDDPIDRIWDKENMNQLNLPGDHVAPHEPDDDSDMLPPTVSTYRSKPIISAPPPDIATLRRDLSYALSEARCAVEEASVQGNKAIPDTVSSSNAQGWYEIQGLQILDVVTLAIRAAKDYYTFHNRPQTLYSIRSERQIRNDLHQALDILKRMANRNFREGIRNDECTGLVHWIDSITDLLKQEQSIEAAQALQRSQWQWLQGDWTGCEREREQLFLSSFHPDKSTIPPWTSPTAELPTDFLKAMSTGLLLIQLHNELVNQSHRRFGSITTFYTDLNKPYRCADNLRYWIKAAELRWQVRLDVDVLDIVYNRGSNTWARFDVAILNWSQTIRRELSTEWMQSPSSLPNSFSSPQDTPWNEDPKTE